MSQGTLFVDSMEEALADAVRMLKGPKAVGQMLWPDKPIEIAAKYLHACLDPDRDEKLSLSQILFIAKRARAVNCHTLIAFLSRELDYKWEAVDPETEVARLQREFTESVNKLSDIQKQLQAKQADVQLRRAA